MCLSQTLITLSTSCYNSLLPITTKDYKTRRDETETQEMVRGRPKKRLGLKVERGRKDACLGTWNAGTRGDVS